MPLKYMGKKKTLKTTTVEPVLKDRSIGHKDIVSQDRWSLVTGSFTLNVAPAKN